MLLLAILVAVAIPATFLFLVRRLDLHASGNVRLLIFCIVWGLLAFIIAYPINTAAAQRVSFGVFLLVVAPVVEELLKSLILIALVRRSDFTYFVDGAIYGFAVGTAFAILETPFYVVTLDGGLSLSLMRSFSTSLMHGSAGALVGVALGRLRFGRPTTRLAALLLGWGAAVALHSGFNRVIVQPLTTAVLAQAVLIGLGGVLLTVLFIRWGLRQERRWLRESLGLSLGVSAGEAAVVQQMADLDALLRPVEARFGREKRAQVESFLRLQARLGLKRTVQQRTPDPALRSELANEVATLRRKVDVLRREVGVYCIIYVRSILPPPSEPLWTQLAQTLSAKRVDDRAPATNLWGSLGSKLSGSNDEQKLSEEG